MDPAEFKSLQVKIRRLHDEMAEQKNLLTEVQRKYNSLKGEYKEALDRLEFLNQTVQISEHALLRFIERTGMIDTEAMKKRILPDDMIENIKVIGSGKYPHPDGVSLVVKNNVVITVKN